jgi:hypothetical protein
MEGDRHIFIIKDIGSTLIRCNFTALDFLFCFQERYASKKKHWVSIPVNLKVSKKGEGRCHCLWKDKKVAGLV